MQVRKDIDVCIVSENIRRTRNITAILKACGNEQLKCTWMVETYGGLRVI